MQESELKERQKVVWKILSNSLQSERLNHAYLFYGDPTACKKEAAMLFAKSILCQHKDGNGFACNSCPSCQAFEHQVHPDFQILSTKAARKSDIAALQDAFSSTGHMESGQRVYIIENFDSARVEAANALLKFLEEPQPGIHAILLSGQKGNILPTILSRVQAISFKPESRRQTALQLEEFLDPQAANMLAGYGYTLEQVQAWQAEKEGIVQSIQQAAWSYINHPESFDEIFSMMQFFAPKKDTYNKEWIQLWLQWLLYFLKGDELELSEARRIKLQVQIVEALDYLKKNVDTALVLDAMYYKNRKAMME